MKKLLERWIKLLDLDGENTKKKVMLEMIDKLKELENEKIT